MPQCAAKPRVAGRALVLVLALRPRRPQLAVARHELGRRGEFCSSPRRLQGCFLVPAVATTAIVSAVATTDVVSAA